MGYLGIEELNGVQDVNFQGSGSGKIDIGEMAMDVGSDHMGGGLNEVVRGVKISQGEGAGVPRNF